MHKKENVALFEQIHFPRKLLDKMNFKNCHNMQVIAVCNPKLAFIGRYEYFVTNVHFV